MAGAPGPVSFAVGVPVVLVTGPRRVPSAVTFTVNVQLAPAARLAPDKLIVGAPATAVIVPPAQVPLTTLGLDTFNPAGRRRSPNATPVRFTAVLGLRNVNVTATVFWGPIDSSPKDLVST